MSRLLFCFIFFFLTGLGSIVPEPFPFAIARFQKRNRRTSFQLVQAWRFGGERKRARSVSLPWWRSISPRQTLKRLDRGWPAEKVGAPPFFLALFFFFLFIFSLALAPGAWPKELGQGSGRSRNFSSHPDPLRPSVDVHVHSGVEWLSGEGGCDWASEHFGIRHTVPAARQ